MVPRGHEKCALCYSYCSTHVCAFLIDDRLHTLLLLDKIKKKSKLRPSRASKLLGTRDGERNSQATVGACGRHNQEKTAWRVAVLIEQTVWCFARVHAVKKVRSVSYTTPRPMPPNPRTCRPTYSTIILLYYKTTAV